MRDVVDEWEEQATAAFMQRAKHLGRRLTLATVGSSLASSAAFCGVCLAVGGVDSARLAARGAILAFVLALAGAHRASKAIMRAKASRWVDELALEHRVPRERLADVAKIFD